MAQLQRPASQRKWSSSIDYPGLWFQHPSLCVRGAWHPSPCWGTYIEKIGFRKRRRVRQARLHQPPSSCAGGLCRQNLNRIAAYGLWRRCQPIRRKLCPLWAGLNIHARNLREQLSFWLVGAVNVEMTAEGNNLQQLLQWKYVFARVITTCVWTNSCQVLYLQFACSPGRNTFDFILYYSAWCHPNPYHTSVASYPDLLTPVFVACSTVLQVTTLGWEGLGILPALCKLT